MKEFLLTVPFSTIMLMKVLNVELGLISASTPSRLLSLLNILRHSVD